MRSVAASLPTHPLTRLFKALGDETRLRMVALLAHGELCVCHLQEALELSQPATSRHLAVLRAAGVVEARRDGSWIYYRLAPQEDGDRRRQMTSLVHAYLKSETLRKDVEQLLAVRGPGACK
jgi:ArsR family transcriptional regulator